VAILPVYIAPLDFWLLRSYCRRVVGFNADVTGWTQTGPVVEWTQGLYFLHLEVHPRFYNWSSNYYTIEYFWDLDASYGLFMGNPVDVGLFFSIPYVFDDMAFDIGVHATMDLSVRFDGDLPAAPSSYWRPLSS